MAESMATVSMSITRPGGLVLNAAAEVPDEMVIEMASMIGAMIFDASVALPPEVTAGE